MILAKAILVIIVNLIIYLSFGSLICVRRGRQWSFAITLVVGFFFYYASFSLICLPIMITYRPLSLLSAVFAVFTASIIVLSLVLNAKSWKEKLLQIIRTIRENTFVSLIIMALVLLQVILAASSYNFTLDAAYYVANVATSVDTNMLNVYDPFTGGWQDHFELRYVFATYSSLDAVVCQLTGLPALVETKLVMSSIVMLLANAIYIWMCSFLLEEKKQLKLIMYIALTLINMTFITIYTSSNFLYSRTYEGKAIVGNMAIPLIFAIFMMIVKEGFDNNQLLMLFVTCLGTATISSTANMVIPAQLMILFTPYIIRHKSYRMIPKLLICILPEIIMMLVYVIYVKGYFAIYTYPRY